ncbi:MAG: Rrf2 family transcriptional regulator [Ignavibacteriaceae bacterium]|nr:Rrf2 family transcriptional regulator [Ignavibacteriaceae bacterium]
MLKLSKKVEYALMAAKFMAMKNSSGYSTAKEISESCMIPYQLVAKVLQNMVKSNLAISAKGTNGGFSLAKNPIDISVIDIIKSVESNYKLVDCLQPKSSLEDCSHLDCCKIRDPLIEIQRKIDKVFSETSLVQIL